MTYPSLFDGLSLVKGQDSLSNRACDFPAHGLARLRSLIGRKALGGSIAKPDTSLRWYRELVAKKHNGSNRRGPRPIPNLRASSLVDQ